MTPIVGTDRSGASVYLVHNILKARRYKYPSSLTTPFEEQFFGAIMTSISPLIAVMLIINQLSVKKVI